MPWNPFSFTSGNTYIRAYIRVIYVEALRSKCFALVSLFSFIFLFFFFLSSLFFFLRKVVKSVCDIENFLISHSYLVPASRFTGTVFASFSNSLSFSLSLCLFSRRAGTSPSVRWLIFCHSTIRSSVAQSRDENTTGVHLNYERRFYLSRNPLSYSTSRVICKPIQEKSNFVLGYPFSFQLPSLITFSSLEMTEANRSSNRLITLWGKRKKKKGKEFRGSNNN